MNFQEENLANKFKPPLILHGPWGTGKTETIIQAIGFLLRKHIEVQQLAQQYNVRLDSLPPQRILLSTLTNSAADLCILKMFDALVMENPSISMLRILAPYRFLSNIDMRILKYCKLNERRDAARLPTVAEILSANLVIVTDNCAISALLRTKELYGKFTHIFIDEAAQAFEPSALGPLVLADPKTVVLLAGYS